MVDTSVPAVPFVVAVGAPVEATPFAADTVAADIADWRWACTHVVAFVAENIEDIRVDILLLMRDAAAYKLFVSSS